MPKDPDFPRTSATFGDPPLKQVRALLDFLREEPTTRYYDGIVYEINLMAHCVLLYDSPDIFEQISDEVWYYNEKPVKAKNSELRYINFDWPWREYRRAYPERARAIERRGTVTSIAEQPELAKTA